MSLTAVLKHIKYPCFHNNTCERKTERLRKGAAAVEKEMDNKDKRKRKALKYQNNSNNSLNILRSH